MPVKKLTFAALLTAVAVVVLVIGTVVPVGRLSMAAIAGIVCMLVAMTSGLGAAWMSFFCTGVLALLIMPLETTFYFIAFFGWYPVFKQWLELIKRRWLAWLVKLFIANAALAVAMLFFKTILLADFGRLTSYLAAAAVVVFNVVFVVYDYALTLLPAQLKRWLPFLR